MKMNLRKSFEQIISELVINQYDEWKEGGPGAIKEDVMHAFDQAEYYHVRKILEEIKK